MVILYGEANQMVEHTAVNGEVSWDIAGVEYKILNVPTYHMHSEEKEYFDMDVTLKIAMIRDLMYAKEIPNIVDFNDIADLQF